MQEISFKSEFFFFFVKRVKILLKKEPHYKDSHPYTNLFVGIFWEGIPQFPPIKSFKYVIWSNKWPILSKWQIYAIVKAKNIHRMFGYIIAKWWAWSTAGRFLLSQAWGCRFESMTHQSWGNKHLLSVPRDVNGPLIPWSTKGSILKILGMDLFFRPDQSDFSWVRSTLTYPITQVMHIKYYIM